MEEEEGDEEEVKEVLIGQPKRPRLTDGGQKFGQRLPPKDKSGATKGANQPFAAVNICIGAGFDSTGARHGGRGEFERIMAIGGVVSSNGEFKW